MRHPKNILILYCQVCGVNETGRVLLPRPMTQEQYMQSQGFADTRCKTCQQDHGTFQEIEKLHAESIQEGSAAAEEFAKKHRTRELAVPKVAQLLNEKSKKKDKIK